MIKKLVCAAVISIFVAGVLAACSDESAQPERDTNISVSAESQTQEMQVGDQDNTWRKQYKDYLQSLIDDSVVISAAWVKDIDGDGIPTVAVSTGEAAFKMPNIMLDFKQDTLVVGYMGNESGSGWSVIDEALFAEGTDYAVAMHRGNTTGTLTYNEVFIYQPAANGEYKTVHEFTVELPADYEAELENLYRTQGSDFDFSKFQDWFADAQETFVRQKLGENVEFYRYGEVVEKFAEYGEFSESEAAADKALKKAISYLNKELGIELVMP